jgi:hypothetical protein
MQRTKELISYHSKEAGYATISLLGNISVVLSDLFIFSAGINLLTKPSVFLNSEVLVACAIAGIGSMYSGKVSSWANEQNNQLWINHLRSTELNEEKI